jgi:hypothetical protein
MQVELVCYCNREGRKRECLKDKINEFAVNSKKKNIRALYRGINEFKRSYQSRNNLVKDDNGDLLADSCNILNVWKNHLSQLFNIHGACETRQIEIHTVQPLVPDLSALGVEIVVAKLK